MKAGYGGVLYPITEAKPIKSDPRRLSAGPAPL